MSRFSESKKGLVPVTALSLVFAGVAVLGGRLYAGPLARFDDVIRLEFVVLDDETSLPVKGAAVRLIDPLGGESDDGKDLATFSDDHGRAAPSRDFNLGELVNEVIRRQRIQGARLAGESDRRGLPVEHDPAIRAHGRGHRLPNPEGQSSRHSTASQK